MSSIEVNEATTQASEGGSVRARSKPLLAVYRALGLAAWTLICYTGNMVARLAAAGSVAKRRATVKWAQRWCRGCLSVAGIRVIAEGDPPDAPALLSPNHVGYLDILALGALARGFFVAKADVESWPVMGSIFRHADQIGVTRERVRGVHETNDRVVERLEQGFSIWVFLEGTSTGGGEVLPFRASLIQPAVDTGIAVVPVGILWRAEDSAIDISEDVAYWKDHLFVSHLWRVLGLRGLHATVIFGRPLDPTGHDRKTLACAAREQVLELLDGAGGSQ